MLIRSKGWPGAPHRRAVLIATFALFALFTTALAEVPLSVGAQEQGSLRVCFYQNSPFIYRTGSGKITGMAVDLVLPILEENGWSVEFKEGNISRCQEDLESGGSDLLLGNLLFDIKDMNSTLVNTIEPIYSNWGIVYSGNENPISTLLELDGAWLGVVKEDPYFYGEDGLQILLENFRIEANLVFFDNYNEVTSAIENGNIDAGVLNSALGWSLEKGRDIKRTSIIFNPYDIGFSASSANGEAIEVLKMLEDEIGTMKEDPNSEYYELLDDYVAGGNGKPSENVIPSWLIRLVVILICTAIFLGITALILRSRVRARTAELREANLRLNKDIDRRKAVENKLVEERNRSLFYLDLLIHDIGNIHQGMVNYIQLDEMVTGVPASKNKTMKGIKDLVDRSIGLVKNIHKFSEAISDRRDCETMDIVPILKDTLSGAVLGTPSSDINIETEFSKGEMLVNCEPLIEELFYNLFHNAVKFHDSPMGKIIVSARTTNDGRWHEIMITDHGMGIPDQHKKTIFDRLERSTERKHRGMGLTLVKVLVERYDGKIEVRNRVEGDHTKGTTFKILLPNAGTNFEKK